MDTASLILFGIRAAVRLGETGFKAYVDLTKNRDLILPLPDDFQQLLPEQVYVFFYDPRGDGYQFYDPDSSENPIFDKPWPRVVELKRDPNELSDEEQAELFSLAREARRLLDVAQNKGSAFDNNKVLSADDMIALTAITGWKSGQTAATAIQRVAGTLVEIGIDYARHNPELFDSRSTVGKTLCAFIEGLDEIPFSELDLDELPARLFVAVLETASAHPEIFAGGKRTQALIQSAGKKVALLVADRIRFIDEQDLTFTEKRALRRDVEEWGELVFRGVLDSAGRLAVSEPGEFLGIRGVGTSELVRRVGNDVLDLMLGRESMRLSTVFSREATERLMRTALDVAGRHPQMIIGSSAGTGLKRILAAAAQELCQADKKLLREDLLPDVARLVLEKTGDNLALLWPSAPESPEKNLLLTAAGSVLESVSRPGINDTWRLDFTDQDLLFVLESVFDEVKRNPGWITGDDIFLKDALTRVLDETFNMIQRHEITLTKDTTLAVLGNVIRGLGLRREFFDDFRHGSIVQPIVVAAVDAVLSTAFQADDAGARWQLVRDHVLEGLVEATISELARSKADETAINELKNVLEDLVAVVKAGNAVDLDQFRAALRNRLVESEG